jgi:hypothetical protein
MQFESKPKTKDPAVLRDLPLAVNNSMRNDFFHDCAGLPDAIGLSVHSIPFTRNTCHPIKHASASHPWNRQRTSSEHNLLELMSTYRPRTRIPPLGPERSGAAWYAYVSGPWGPDLFGFEH